MRDTHLDGMDLNLLRAIQPLLEERHVSRAAKRSFLSQPAMSRALDRLRDAFGDPLLVRSGRGYERTPRGERVLREIEPIMRRLQAIVRDEEFTPAQSQERFRVAMSDHGSTILLPPLLRRLRKEAPQCELLVTATGPQTYDEVAAGRIDLHLCPEPPPSVLENEILFKADFVCLFGRGQPTRNRRLTLKEYLQLPHVMILTDEGHQAMIDQPLEALGLKRRVALRIPFFIPALFAIAETDLVLTVPRSLATITAGLAALGKVEPPREIRTFPYFMSWHSRLMKEASHAWLREQIRVAASEVSTANKKVPRRPALSI
jgi:DNA-binding transcriptional LysR family regulator